MDTSELWVGDHTDPRLTVTDPNSGATLTFVADGTTMTITEGTVTWRLPYGNLQRFIEGIVLIRRVTGGGGIGNQPW